MAKAVIRDCELHDQLKLARIENPDFFVRLHGRQEAKQ